MEKNKIMEYIFKSSFWLLCEGGHIEKQMSPQGASEEAAAGSPEKIEIRELTKVLIKEMEK